jgi:hypothetical protein
MQTNRRQFLRIAGLTTGGFISGLSSLSQFFEFIPAQEQNFLPLSGILANPSSILDKGVHLRWSLPPSKGIPEIIKIFRRKSNGASSSIRINPANSGLAQLPSSYSELSFQGSNNSFSLTDTQYGRCYKVKPVDPAKKIRIEFSESITSCTLQLGNVNKSKIQAFYPDDSLAYEFFAENASAFSPFLISAPKGRPIKSIEIQLNFSYLYFIEFTGNQYLCDGKGWELVGQIDNANDFKENNLIKRISPTTRNHYIKSNEDWSDYIPIAERYYGMLTAMYSPNEMYFNKKDGVGDIAAIPFSELTFKSRNAGDPRVNAYNLLMLGCLDPNVARLAGLYFVDTSVREPSTVYDYKVEAGYNNSYFKKSICGVILNIGAKYSEKPFLDEPLITTQINSTRWEFDGDYKATQLGQVRLAWKSVDQNPSNEGWKKFIEPVLYSLLTNVGPSRHIAPRLDNLNFYFIDQNAPVKELKYSVFGIDLFGQESNTLKATIQLTDKTIPASPVKLNFNQEVDNVFLNFEYGGFQYLTDPEISKLDIYTKANSIYVQNLRVKYQSFEVIGRNNIGNRLLVISLLQNINEATKFGVLHFLEHSNGRKLSAVKRKKFRIVEQAQNRVTIILENEDKFLPETSGLVLLEADARDKNIGWTKLNASPITFNRLVQTRLLNYSHFVKEANDVSHFTSSQNIGSNNSFVANITQVRFLKYSDNKDLFDNRVISEAEDAYTEITINRTINESGIFAQGKLKFQQAVYTIESQNAGYGNANSEDLRTKLIVKRHIPVSRGEVLMIPPETKASAGQYISNYMLLWLSFSDELKNIHTGEFLFRGTKVSLIKELGENAVEVITQKEEQIHIPAILMSDTYPVGNRLQVLVNIATKSTLLHTQLSPERSNRVLYFSPYRIDVTNNIQGIQLAPKDAFKNAYFTATATDESGKESPLSVIAQFIKTRSKKEKPPTPAPPFPCDNPNATEAFLKLPNSEGLSYFKLCWNGSADYRYEVARALDKSIIASHRDLWLRGLSYSSDAEQALSSVTLLSIGSVNSVNGTVEVIISAAGISDASIYIGGRLLQGAGSNKKCFEVIKLVPETGDRLKLLLRPMNKVLVPSGSNCSIHKLPNYKSILDDDQELKQLADIVATSDFPDIPDGLGAFTVVTGQPLRDELNFLDEVPGLGTSRFLYKLRAVDGSENRSAWSRASVPVMQVDTRAPEAPIITYIEGQEQAALLKWKYEFDPIIVEYNLYRTNKRVDPKVSADFQEEVLIKRFVKQNPGVNDSLVSPSRLRVRFDQLKIPAVLGLELSINMLRGIYLIKEDGSPDLAKNFFISNTTSLSNQSVLNLPPDLPDSTLVIVVLNTVANTELVVYQNDLGSLKVDSGSISLPALSNLNSQKPIVGVFIQGDYQFGKSVAEQPSRNFLVNDITILEVKNRILKNLHIGLTQSETVAVKYVTEGNIEMFVSKDETEYEFVDELKDVLTADLFYNYRLEAVKSIRSSSEMGKIFSVKSKSALVQIKMNTPPALPEIISVEWWDITSNRSPSSTTSIFGIKLKGKLDSNKGTYLIKVLNPNTNLMKTIKVVDASALLPNNGKYYFEELFQYSDKEVGCAVSLVFTNLWNQSSEISSNLNSFAL